MSYVPQVQTDAGQYPTMTTRPNPKERGSDEITGRDEAVFQRGNRTHQAAGGRAYTNVRPEDRISLEEAAALLNVTVDRVKALGRQGRLKLRGFGSKRYTTLYQVDLFQRSKLPS